jgi:putative oxidoreductase
MQLPVPAFIKNDPTIILRITLFVILIMHSIPGMLNGGVNAFGTHLNEVGFAPIGVPLAWAIKLSHVVCAVLLLINRYITAAAIITIIILIAGIVMVHFKEGWYVVGGGRNGSEFNVLLIAVLLYLMIRNRI